VKWNKNIPTNFWCESNFNDSIGSKMHHKEESCKIIETKPTVVNNDFGKK
jgi:hypothetical protein